MWRRKIKALSYPRWMSLSVDSLSQSTISPNAELKQKPSFHKSKAPVSQLMDEEHYNNFIS